MWGWWWCATTDCTGDVIRELSITSECKLDGVAEGFNYYVDCEGAVPAPTLEPTESPIQVNENEYDPVCDDGYICSSCNECEADTPCSSSDGCEDGYICEIDGGFCYYDECVSTDSDGCDDNGFICIGTAKTKDGVDYESGVCRKLADPPSANDGYRFIFGMIVFVVIGIVWGI